MIRVLWVTNHSTHPLSHSLFLPFFSLHFPPLPVQSEESPSPKRQRLSSQSVLEQLTSSVPPPSTPSPPIRPWESGPPSRRQPHPHTHYHHCTFMTTTDATFTDLLPSCPSALLSVHLPPLSVCLSGRRLSLSRARPLSLSLQALPPSISRSLARSPPSRSRSLTHYLSPELFSTFLGLDFKLSRPGPRRPCDDNRVSGPTRNPSHVTVTRLKARAAVT